MKDLNQELPCTTVGELRKLIQDMPDDWELVTTNDDADCIPITHVNSFWHGALTFEYEK